MNVFQKNVIFFREDKPIKRRHKGEKARNFMLKNDLSPLSENIGSLFMSCVFQQLIVVLHEVIRKRYFYRTRRGFFSLEKHGLLGFCL